MGEPQFEALLDRVRACLPEYLKEKGVTWDEQGWFRCINPVHEDKNPSCHFVEARDVADQTRFKCFGCGAAGDIFTAANYFDQKPREGKAWVVENVYWLADKYGIEHEKLELSDKEILVLKQQRLFNDAAELLTELCENNPAFYENAEARGVWRDTCKQFGIGTVPWNTMMTGLIQRGWTEAFARSSGIDESHFHERYITFTLRDMNGRVVGFDRRYVDYDPAQHAAYRAAKQWYPPKYLTTNQEKCHLLDKSTLLYNIHFARRRQLRRLDVFEGFMDWATAYQAGHECCTAMCGTAFTDLMVAVIRVCGFPHVNLVMDGDPAGMLRMLGGVDDQGRYKAGYVEKFKGQEGLHVTIMPLRFSPEVPLKDRDVDYYLRSFPTLTEGLQNFMQHKPISAFEWMLEKRIQDGTEPRIVAKEMVQFIVNERSQVDRGVLCHTLAERLHLSEADVRVEVDRIANQKFDEITETTAVRIKRATNTEQRIRALEEGQEAVEAARAGGEDLLYDPSESMDFIVNTIEEFKTTEKGILGYTTGWRSIDIGFGGIPRSKEVLFFAGMANTGKSTTVLNITTQVLGHNEEPTVVFFSFDDPRKTSQAKLLAIMSGIPIQYVVQPQEHIFPYPDLTERYDQAIDQMKEWAESGRLVLKGVEVGNNPTGMERVIRTTQERLGRPVLVMIDSFHSIGGMGESERINFKRAADWCQRTSDILDVTIICTAECTKAASEAGRARIKDIIETQKVEYAGKIIGMVHNDMHVTRGKTKRNWSDQGTPRAILEIEIEKNKITSFKDTLYFKLREPTAQLWETTIEAGSKTKPVAQPPPMTSPDQVGRPQTN